MVVPPEVFLIRRRAYFEVTKMGLIDRTSGEPTSARVSIVPWEIDTV
jgi:hypothetical protein